MHTLGNASHATDQAAGLRRMFGASRKRFLALAHNEQVEHGSLVIDRLCDAASALGLHTLVVDAADNAPAPHEMALIDLPSCVEALSDDVSYLAARGLPIRHVDSQGRCAAFLEALEHAAPQADLVLVHAGTIDLTRLFAPPAHATAAGRRRHAACDDRGLCHAQAAGTAPGLAGARPADRGRSEWSAHRTAGREPGRVRRAFSRRGDPRLRGDRPAARARTGADARLVHLLRAQMAQDLLQDSTAMPPAHHAPAVH